jgi:hypothetical protein
MVSRLGNYKTTRSLYNIPVSKKQVSDELDTYSTYEPENHNYQTTNVEPEPVTINAEQTTIFGNTSSPEIWGPSFWFMLHNGASKYPISASPIQSDRMKSFILGLPVMIPCEKCKEHATSYIENNYKNLDKICNSRSNLFEFFVNFHNRVNERYEKPLMSVENALKLYSGNVQISKMSYTNV